MCSSQSYGAENRWRTSAASPRFTRRHGLAVEGGSVARHRVTRQAEPGPERQRPAGRARPGSRRRAPRAPPRRRRRWSGRTRPGSRPRSGRRRSAGFHARRCPPSRLAPPLRLRSSRSAGHKRGARERVPDARRVRLVYVHPRHPRSRPGVNTQPSIQACKLIRGSAEPDRLASSVRAACRPRAGTGRPNRLLISRWPGQIGDRLREYCSDAEGYESRLSAAEAERRVPGAVRVDPIGRVPPGAAMPWRRRSPAAGPTTRLRSPRESRARRDVDLSDEFSGEDGRPDPDQADEPESLDHLVSTG